MNSQLTIPGVPFEEVIKYLQDKDLVNLQESGNPTISTEIIRLGELQVRLHPEYKNITHLNAPIIHQQISRIVAQGQQKVVLQELIPTLIIGIDLAQEGQIYALSYLISGFLNKSVYTPWSPECYQLCQFQQEYALGHFFKAAQAKGHSYTCAHLFMYMNIFGVHPFILDKYFHQIVEKGWEPSLKWVLDSFYVTDPARIPVAIVDYAFEHLPFLDWMYDSGYFSHQTIGGLFTTLDEAKIHADVTRGDTELLKWFVQKVGIDTVKTNGQIMEIVKDYLRVGERFHRQNIVNYIRNTLLK